MGIDSPGRFPSNFPVLYLGEPQATRVLDVRVRIVFQPGRYPPQRRLDANHSPNSIPNLSRFPLLLLENWRSPGHRQGYRPPTQGYQAGMVIRQICVSNRPQDSLQPRRCSHLSGCFLVLLELWQHQSISTIGSFASSLCNHLEQHARRNFSRTTGE